MTTASTGSSATYVAWTFTNRPPEEPPPAGALVPAPEPFPPGPLRWDAIRLDAPDEIGAR